MSSALPSSSFSPNQPSTVPPTEAGTCRNCGEAFDVPQDEDDECSGMHTGVLRFNSSSDVWYGWHAGNGPKDTDVVRERFPDGFKWSCCGESGLRGSRCTESEHVAEVEGEVEPWRKLRAMEAKAAGGGDDDDDEDEDDWDEDSDEMDFEDSEEDEEEDDE